ncbi:MAG: hypothetical protein NVV72_01010 [Asticcacaulis sp.]|nr:hypothetical protein [Asticcacaulis sp.]
MRHLVDRIAGVAFSLALSLTDDDGGISDIAPGDYTWSLRGKAAEASGPDDPVAFALTSQDSQIAVVDGEVVCSFSAAASEGLAGLYRLQLIGYLSGQAVLGGEPDPLRFVPRY